MNRPEVFWILLPLIIFVWKTENIGVNSCIISDDEFGKHKQNFKHLSSLRKGMQFIYVNISSPSFENLTLNMKTWNKITDWIWITHEYRHYLSYPVDIDVFTLGLMKQNSHTLNLNVSIHNISVCNNDTLSIQIYHHLFKIHNSTSGYFCYRYFDNQEWKEFLFFIAYVSVGYEFKCFNGLDMSSPFTVKKSPIIYITIAIILIIISYYPMILSRSMHERKVRRELVVYTKADYPYTPRRFFLRIMFQTGDLKFENLSEFQKNFSNSTSATRISILIYIVTVTAFIVKVILTNHCEVCFHPNVHLFQEIYFTHGVSELSIALIVITTILSFFALSALNNSILVLSKESSDQLLLFDYFFCKFIPIRHFLKHIDIQESISRKVVNRLFLLFSLKFWGQVYLIPLKAEQNSVNIICTACVKYIGKVIFSPIIFLLNILCICIFSLFPILNQLFFLYLKISTLALRSITTCTCTCKFKGIVDRRCFSFLCIICIFLSLVTIGLSAYCNAIFMGVSCIVQFFIYFILVAIPHLYSTQLYIFLIVTAIFTYMSKFFLQFFQLYRLLLQKIIQLKGTNDILIEDYDYIVRRCCPVKMEIFFLLAKVLMTSFLLVIMYLTLIDVHFLEGEKSFDLNIFLTYVFILLTPGVIEVLFFESNADKVEKMHYDLDELIRQLTSVHNLDCNGIISEDDLNEKKIRTTKLIFNYNEAEVPKSGCKLCCKILSEFYCGCFWGCCNDINCGCSSSLMNENEGTEENNEETRNNEENVNGQVNIEMTYMGEDIDEQENIAISHEGENTNEDETEL
ncbi:uncharacterized protein LOC134274036 [Saccostrea cucullata]|uniref:uncharacterized protein LOC134274036 n=1 Tax=Saccostrea cuccullata TaxID=36930 RepID=UPI002ED2E586